MDSSAVLEGWCSSHRDPRAHFQIVDGKLAVRFDEGVTNSRISLRQPPEGFEDIGVVVDAGSLNQLEVRGGTPTMSIQVVATAPNLRLVIGAQPEEIRVEAGEETTIRLSGVSGKRVSLVGGVYELEREAVEQLCATDCTVRRPNTSPDISSLKPRGSVTLDSSEWAIKQLDLSDAPNLRVVPNRKLKAEVVMLPEESDPPRLSGAFEFGSDRAANPFNRSATIALEEGAKLMLIGVARGMGFSGAGTISVSDELIEPRFEGDSLNLHCLPGARVLVASGCVQQLICERAVVKGLPGNPIRPRTLRNVDQSVLLDIDCFSLTEASLDSLQASTQFAPWVPLLSYRAVKMLRSMKLARDDVTEEWRRARFWQRITRLADEKHASGHTQSQARFVYGAARKDAAKSGREKFWLSMYSLIGYGERVLRPLLWFGLVTLTAWLILSSPFSPYDLGDTTLADMFGLPLRFFRTLSSDTESIDGGLWWILVAIQLFGLVMIFFSLSAIRRISKAE